MSEQETKFGPFTSEFQILGSDDVPGMSQGLVGDGGRERRTWEYVGGMGWRMLGGQEGRLRWAVGTCNQSSTQVTTHERERERERIYTSGHCTHLLH
ncbi:hypothetical protein KC19_9G190500 [Ceratodon purpureus]|uniref:Uncharacterized protein n=1 Tax=Ceratodon purpureus TaxID=3225 RepID=A0A8T0GXM3_CERPU|nr:hypothetical protein KC19_9G190500 [Ceratodon purpureus]